MSRNDSALVCYGMFAARDSMHTNFEFDRCQAVGRVIAERVSALLGDDRVALAHACDESCDRFSRYIVAFVCVHHASHSDSCWQCTLATIECTCRSVVSTL